MNTTAQHTAAELEQAAAKVAHRLILEGVDSATATKVAALAAIKRAAEGSR